MVNKQNWNQRIKDTICVTWATMIIGFSQHQGEEISDRKRQKDAEGMFELQLTTLIENFMHMRKINDEGHRIKFGFRVGKKTVPTEG